MVTPPGGQSNGEGDEAGNRHAPAIWEVAPGSFEGEEGAMARINLRLPDQLKGRVEHAASTEGLSVNAWLVRAAAAALEQASPGRPHARRGPRGGQHYVGWGR